MEWIKKLTFKIRFWNLNTNLPPRETYNFEYERIGRSSSPSPNFCEHCKHGHRKRCCLYYGDGEEDKAGYGYFKANFDREFKQQVKIFPQVDDALSANTSPYFFPNFTNVHVCILKAPKKSVRSYSDDDSDWSSLENEILYEKSNKESRIFNKN